MSSLSILSHGRLILVTPEEAQSTAIEFINTHPQWKESSSIYNPLKRNQTVNLKRCGAPKLKKLPGEEQRDRRKGSGEPFVGNQQSARWATITLSKPNLNRIHLFGGEAKKRGTGRSDQGDNCLSLHPALSWGCCTGSTFRGPHNRHLAKMQIEWRTFQRERVVLATKAKYGQPNLIHSNLFPTDFMQIRSKFDEAENYYVKTELCHFGFSSGPLLRIYVTHFLVLPRKDCPPPSANNLDLETWHFQINKKKHLKNSCPVEEHYEIILPER